jgi:2-oxo-4-hydroxy-4-carboxy-5-ureidoimidazoline decarboxylase
MDLYQRINDARSDVAREMLQRANGSSRWVDLMMARRPFASADALQSVARSEWFSLGEDDWLEAFSHHPKIGDRASLEKRFPSTHDLSSKEQSRIGGANAEVIAALQEANEVYLKRFGFIFIVCATGKSAEEMLTLLRDRLSNNRATELRIAAEEQAKITALRLGAGPLQ